MRLGVAYWDAYAARYRTGLRVGRQSYYSAGVPGRFDGVRAIHRLNSQSTVGMVAGFANDSSYLAPTVERPLIGIHGAYETADGRLKLEPFFIQQYAEGVLDRRAVGLQTQLRMGKALAFSMVDYDLHHAALNNLSLMTDLRLSRGSNISLSYDFRRNPYLAKRSALIGQPFDDLASLAQQFVNLRLDEIAADRTATSQTVRVGLNKKISERWSFSTDLAAASLSATRTSANVAGQPARDDLYFSMQLRSTGASTYSAIMLRRAESDTSSTTSMYWNSRFRLFGSWWVYPRVRLDYRSFDRTDQTQISIIPTLRLDYRRRAKLRFELETGYEWTTRKSPIGELDVSGFFVRAGYRAMF